MRRIMVAALVTLVTLAWACTQRDGEPAPPNGRSDPYDGLWDVAIGQVKCSGDSCCIRRCSGNQDTVCATRDMDLILRSLDPTSPFSEECTAPLFPDWFINHDCFVAVGGFVNPLTGQELKVEANDYDSERRMLRLSFIQCFCGRTASSYSSEYSTAALAFRFDGCDIPLVAIDLRTGEEGFDQAIVACDNPCNPCKRRCDGRECGADGCGGSCGACPAEKTCSAAGHCVSQQDTCSACISACRGLPGCCMGCGCICQSACGQCF